MKTADALAILGATALLVFALWLFFFAPCSWLWWSATKDLPVRCLAAYARGAK